MLSKQFLSIGLVGRLAGHTPFALHKASVHTVEPDLESARPTSVT